MSTILSVTEVAKGRKGKVDQEDSGYTRTFIVRTDDPLMGAKMVLADELIPKPDDLYSTSLADEADDEAACTDVEAVQLDEDQLFWVVTANYDTTALNPEKSKDPLKRPPVLKMGSRKVKRALTHDPDTGAPIKNTAGDPFIPPPETERSIRTIIIVQNQSAYDDTLMKEYENTVNVTEWKGYEAKTVLCEEISAEQQWHKGVAYWAVTYKFAVDDFETNNSTGGGTTKGWAYRILNIGKRYLDAVTGDPVPAMLSSGHITSEGVLLNEIGRQLANGEDPQYVVVNYKTSEFADLQIGDIGL